MKEFTCISFILFIYLSIYFLTRGKLNSLFPLQAISIRTPLSLVKVNSFLTLFFLPTGLYFGPVDCFFFFSFDLFVFSLSCFLCCKRKKSNKQLYAT